MALTTIPLSDPALRTKYSRSESHSVADWWLSANQQHLEIITRAMMDALHDMTSHRDACFFFYIN
jgi:hypothetical protein